MLEQLEIYLARNFGIEVIERPLELTSSVLINSPMGTDKVLILHEDISQKERTYLALLSAAHILLGHDSSAPLGTIVEPLPEGSSFQLTPEEENQRLQARILAQGILKKRVNRYWDVIWDAVNEAEVQGDILVEDVRAEALALSRLV